MFIKVLDNQIETNPENYPPEMFPGSVHESVRVPQSDLQCMYLNSGVETDRMAHHQGMVTQRGEML